MIIEKIISGGQTGVDRAALDIAITNHVNHGGWCPKGRKAEDGTIDKRYELQETDADDYRCRTEWNVRDSDATLVLYTGLLSGGTALTVELTRTYSKPLYILNIDEPYELALLIQWLDDNDIKVLNIAGPRESNNKGIYRKACRLLQELVDQTGVNGIPHPHS